MLNIYICKYAGRVDFSRRCNAFLSNCIFLSLQDTDIDATFFRFLDYSRASAMNPHNMVEHDRCLLIYFHDTARQYPPLYLLRDSIVWKELLDSHMFVFPWYAFLAFKIASFHLIAVLYTVFYTLTNIWLNRIG
jgi:hypothetical protein